MVLSGVIRRTGRTADTKRDAYLGNEQDGTAGETPGPRFAALAADSWGEAEYEAFGALLGVPGEKVPRAGSGHRYDPLNFDIMGQLVRNPELARCFLTFNSYLLFRAALSSRLRELVVLRVAHRQRCGYEWAQHVKAAHEAGITDEEIQRLAVGNDGFEGPDRLVLDATDELLDTGRIAPGTWAAMLDELGVHEAMDLIFCVGTYAMLATVFETWGFTPVHGSPSLPEANES